MCVLFYEDSLKTAEAKCIFGRVRTSACVCICVCVRKGLIWRTETVVLDGVRVIHSYSTCHKKTTPPTLKVTFSTQLFPLSLFYPSFDTLTYIPPVFLLPFFLSFLFAPSLMLSISILLCHFYLSLPLF